jgi:hypothetical protein
MRLGPILGFRGQQNGCWSCSILSVGEGTAPPVTVSAGQLRGPVVLGTVDGSVAWRWDVAIPQLPTAQRVTYRVGDQAAYTFAVPAVGAPLRHAYVSCNGFSSKKLAETTKDPYGLWRQIGVQHAAKPFNLLLCGGDQVYADAVFDLIDGWSERTREKKLTVAWTAKRKAAAERFYQRLYLARWAQPEMAAAFASIPTLMMWDDHDIFDGWGSYDPELQACPVYQGIYAAARDAFRLFQLQCAPGERVPGAVGTGDFSWCYDVGDTTVWAPDLRSNRNQNQVVDPAVWNALYARLDATTGKRHLLVMSSIPVVYPNFKAVEAVLGWMPGEQELEDDLKDHWRTSSHQEERLRLIHRLLRFAQTTGTRVTLLSGDVHVGACGVLESSRPGATATINQLVATGVVHPPPQALVAWLLDKLLAGYVDEVDRGITARMLPFTGTTRKLRPARNWLSLSGDDQGRLWAEWWFEGDATSTTKVIHPASVQA